MTTIEFNLIVLSIVSIHIVIDVVVFFALIEIILSKKEM
jgi:hypothetical protein